MSASKPINCCVRSRKSPVPRREAPDDRPPFGRAGAFRRDGRSRSQEDLPGTLCAGETRRPEGPGHRRRLAELEPQAAGGIRMMSLITAAFLPALNATGHYDQTNTRPFHKGGK